MGESQIEECPAAVRGPSSSASSLSRNDDGNGVVRVVDDEHDVEKAERGLESSQTPQDQETKTDLPPLRALSLLDRYLVVLILLSMALGMLLGTFVPSTAPALQTSSFAGVSLPIAIGLLVMMYPLLCKIRFSTLPAVLRTRALWTHLLISLLLNWLVAPLLMLALAWAFLPDEPALRDGLIFVGVARCIAMVLVWVDLAGGDAQYCALLVAFNSILQVALFAPLAVFYTRVVSGDDDVSEGAGHLGYAQVATSVAAFLGVPLAAAVVTRLGLCWAIGEDKYTRRFLRYVGPLSLLGLLYTIVVLFASQGAHVVRQITSVLRVSAPLVVYFAVMFLVTAWGMRRAGYGYGVGCVQSFTAASNNFELAIAVVVSVYGAGSEQALASTVGPLIEVPVLVSLVYAMKYFRKRWGWDE